MLCFNNNRYLFKDDTNILALKRKIVKTCLREMGPSVTMGALTTIVAGQVMGLCKTLFFLRFGKFLVVVMTCSWMFTNFFFLPCVYVLPISWLSFDLIGACKNCFGKNNNSNNDDDEILSGSGWRNVDYRHRKLSDNDYDFQLNERRGTQ